MYDLYCSGYDYDYEPEFGMWDDSMEYDLEGYPLWISKKKKKRKKKKGGMGKLKPLKKKKKRIKPLTKAQQIANAIKKAVTPVTTVPLTTTPSLATQLQGFGISPAAATEAAQALLGGTSAPDLPYTIVPFKGSGLGPNIIYYEGDCQLGNDIGGRGYRYPAASYSECLQNCIRTPECRGFSWNEDLNHCYLKPGVCVDPLRPDAAFNGFNFTQIRA